MTVLPGEFSAAFAKKYSSTVANSNTKYGTPSLPERTATGVFSFFLKRFATAAGIKNSNNLKLVVVEKKKVRERGSERGEGGFQIGVSDRCPFLSLSDVALVFFFSSSNSTCFWVAFGLAGGADVVVRQVNVGCFGFNSQVYHLNF